MANLIIKFADLTKDPIGSGRDVSAEVLVSYTREVPLTDGTVLQPVPTRKQLGAGGTAIFEVTPSDDPTVQADFRGFGLRVEWLMTHRAGRGRQTETRGARTVKVLAADGATVQFGRLLPAEDVGPQYATVGELLDDVTAVYATVDNLAATATALPPGATPTVTVTGAIPNKVINIGVPRGADGAPGMGYEEGRQLLAQNAATLDSAAQAAQRAENAEAATLEVPDANTAAMIGNPVTDTAQALTTFQDQRSRAAALTDAAAPPMRWWVLRRSPDTFAIVAALPSGLFWSWDLMRDNTNPGGFRTCITGNYSCIGVPMKYAPYQDATYTGGTWARFSSLIGTSGLPLPGLMPGAMDIQLSVTAGDRNTDPVDYPGPFPDRAGHGIVIHGAGEGGADFETRVGNVSAQGRIVLAANPLPPATGTFAATVYPAFIISASNDATATATYTTPAGSTRVGVSSTPTPAGGIWSVTLDGDDFAANMAPTGRELLDAGYVTAADMAPDGPISFTKRYVDFHYSQAGTHRPIGLARGLAPGAHTVVLKSTGVKHPTGSNVRAPISGWAYGDESMTPDSDDVSVYGQWWVIPEESAIEFAHEMAPTAGGTPTFIGSQHGWENQIGDLAVAVDGVPYDLAPGEGVGGTLVTVTRTSQLHHPDAVGAVADVTYEWSAATGTALRCSHRMTFLQPMDITAGYPVHCNIDAATLPYGMVDTSGTVITWDRDDAFEGVARNRVIAAWGKDVAFIENVPAVEQATGGWSSNPNILHSIRDRSAGPGRRWAKTYLSRNGTPEVGSTWAASAEYAVALAFGDFTPPA